jgi:hypothetical protein
MLDLILITLSSLLSGLRGQAALQAENIALHHRLTVLQRTIQSDQSSNREENISEKIGTRDIKLCFVPVATELSRTLSNDHRRLISRFATDTPV